MNVFSASESAAALLQAAVTLGLAAVFFYLYRRHRKRHFFWWGVAWTLYALRLVAIIAFLGTSGWSWLFWHQVITGWTALALLWTALVFARQSPWRPGYLLLAAVPALWAYLAIFVLDSFLLAAGPTVAFLSLTTLWTAIVFWRYASGSGSQAARLVAGTLTLWSLHHLDYPFLRARGAWNPWGYYADTLLLLAMGAGVLLLVIEELHQGLRALTALSGDLQHGARADALDALLERPLGLHGVRGAAVYEAEDGPDAPPRLLRGAGECREWSPGRLAPPVLELLWRALREQRPLVQGGGRIARGAGAPPFAAVLPLLGGAGPRRVLLIVGDVSVPFTALDDGILVAVGGQIGAALEHAELHGRLVTRTADLERLSVRMIQQHEEQRAGLARELHDETAQVFSALKLQLGSLREDADPALAPRFGRLVELVDVGNRSIRSVTDALRPSLLDDLGLVPAIRALVADFRQWSGVEVDMELPEGQLPLSPEGELALFRAVQEGLSNVARHAQAGRVRVTLRQAGALVHLDLADDGAGLDAGLLARLASGPGRSGLFGMRERIAASGGTVRFESAPGTGFLLRIEIPAGTGARR